MGKRIHRVSKYAFAGVTAMSLFACGSKSDSNGVGAVRQLDDAPVIAEKVVVGNDTVVVADLSSVDRTLTLKLSELAEDIEVVRLDNNNEALVGTGMVWVTGNRIMIYSNSDGIVRQFDRSGKYIGRIGNRGQGPGEYAIAPYDIYMDEKAGRIYMNQFAATKIFEYDTQGVFIKDIPLSYKLEKGQINVDNATQTITVAAMPFKDAEHLDNVWVQDFDGNVKSSDTKPWLAVDMDYSNEIRSGVSYKPANFDYSLFSVVPRPDSLYVYRDSQLHPAFTTNMGVSADKTPMHLYLSTPNLYVMILFSAPELVMENSYILPAMTPLVVDRKSLHGGFAKLMIDNIGLIELEGNWLEQSNSEYFVMPFDPGELLDKIEAAPQKHDDVDDSVIESMNKFKETVNPDDNNYIVIGKWKK